MENKYVIPIIIVIAVLIIGLPLILLGIEIFDPLLALLIINPSILIIILICGIWIAQIRRKEVKAGFPAEDERSKKIRNKAGYYAFFGVIYINLVLMWYAFFGELFGLPELTPMFIPIISIVAGSIIFFTFHLYISKRGAIN